ncbi:hypothetical protein Taro_013162 [Colocasia esculenta]|uniref:Senescence regulator n=1 Tax=Colocasia esculenta TaxID=4460 RepID=A0A843U5V4_COLES|nr:hypothetical protein [Colocasia esculenta]
MDTFSHRRSPPADRFLGLFSSPPGDLTTAAAAASDGPGVELREDEVFWWGAELSPQSPSAAANHRGRAVPLRSPSSPGSFRSLSEKSIGILSALPEREAGKPGFLRRNHSTSPAWHAAASPSPPSSARMIPAIPKPRHAGYSSVQHQSAPLDVPVVSGRRRGGSPVTEPDSDDYDDDEMLPPHEIVARKGAPATTSSVLEGVGRTLKGRDLRRVRNAVWRQTGFLDCN